MSQPQPIQVLEEHQDLVQKLLPEINKILDQSHFSFHVNSAERIIDSSGTEYHFKIKSNDGQLYKVVVFQPNGDKPTEVREGSSLYTTIDRIAGYKNTINDTYKVANSSYSIVSVQQLIDDPSSYVFKVKGAEDNKLYKVKIEKPIVAHVNRSPEIIPQSKITSS